MPASSATLRVELDLFRGPLHTLLELIERHELPVTRVSLVAVTDQFLALVQAAPVLDLDLTAEFLHVAARLLLLKSQALLPRATDEEPRDEDNVDTEADLEERLLLYRRFRDVASALAARQESGLRLFGRVVPPHAALDAPVRLDPRRLRRVAARAFARIVAAERAKVGAPAPLVSFALVLQAVVERLRGRRQARFSDIVAEAPDVITAITMFLAVLELIRSRQVVLHQQGTFGPINLTVERE